MFTSNNTLNPFTSSSSSYNLSPYIIDHEIINNHNNNNYNVFFNIPPISPQFISTMQNIEGSNNVINGDQHQQHDPPFVEKSVKKDRHSKIYTAHGLRDRRVRLSIEISRKFFDLQDMLGFDKASKTLEWLLTKSGEAIKELEGAKSLSSSSTTFEEGVVSKKDQSMAASDDKRKKKIKIKKVAAAKESNPVAKESRAKARERARERTRVRKLHDDMLSQSISSILNPQHQIQGAFCNDSVKIVHDHHQVMEELPANNSHISSSSSLANPIPKRNIIEESIVIKRKLKPCTMMGYQQNLVMFKDVSCNNNLMTNFSQNWDINSAIAHSSYRTAALRQAMGG